MNIGIEIGGTKLQIGVGDPVSGEIEKVYRYEVEMQKGAKGILDTIEKTLQGFTNQLKAIGVGFGGPMDIVSGKIASSHHINGWDGFALKEWFQQRYKVPVAVENDANAAALGEAYFGAGKGVEKMFYITLGSGVGGGLVTHKRLYHGISPGEAEIGLLCMERSGTTLESMCSGWALDLQIREAVKGLDNTSILKKKIGNEKKGEAKYLISAMQEQDPTALSIFSKYSDNLAWGLSHMTHLFNPELVVLGGGVSLMGEQLAVAVQEKLPKYLVKTYRPGPDIRISAIGENVVVVGALCLLNQI